MIEGAAAAAVWFPVVDLVPWEDNPWSHPEAQLEELRASFARHGWGEPVVAQADTCKLIAGHGRVSAALALLEADPAWQLEDAPGPGLIPVRFRELADDLAHELALISNRAHRLAVQDDDALGRVLRELSDDEPRIIGYDDSEIEEALRRAARQVKRKDVKPPPVPQPPKRPVSQVGEVYELGPHRLLCADSCQLEDVEIPQVGPDGDPAPSIVVRATVDRLIDLMGGRASIVFTDPPFAIYGSSSGIGSDIADDRMVRPMFRDILHAAQRATDVFDPVYVCCDWRSWASWWEVARGTSLGAKNLLVWDKGGAGLGSNYANTYELIGYFLHLPQARAMQSAEARGIRPVLASNVVWFNRPHGDERKHNAAKPVPLIEEVVGHHLEPGDQEGWVLDLFGGSGSTLIAAARQGWRCALVEIDPAWCDVIRKRWTEWARAAGVDPGPGALE